MPSHSRTVIVVAAAFVTVISSSRASLSGRQDPAAPRPQRNPAILALEKDIAGKEQLPAEQVFKNIQTFKGMPAIRVLRIMEQAFVPNLGVECTYCHVEGDWSSDEKRPKGIARGMWTLRAEVQEQVRKVTGKPDVPVTCYTCHKGEPKPKFAIDR